jgi:hypothetical protein
MQIPAPRPAPTGFDAAIAAMMILQYGSLAAAFAAAPKRS